MLDAAVQFVNAKPLLDSQVDRVVALRVLIFLLDHLLRAHGRVREAIIVWKEHMPM